MPKERLTSEDLAKAHDGLCGVSIGDGPCSCLVQWVKGLQEEADKLKLERRGFQIMAREMFKAIDPGFWRAAIEDGKYERAGGDAECRDCRIVFCEHPQLPGLPTFHMLCNGSIVKT